MSAPSESLQTVDQVESTPQGIVKRWVAELDLARSNEEEWRKLCNEIWDLYRSKNRKANSFNILWSNTETLSPALYNSKPRPDVRPLHKNVEPSPPAKQASKILRNALTYEISNVPNYDFDKQIKDTILDVALPGRGLARIKYEPKFRAVEEDPDDGLGEAGAPAEEVYDEVAQCCHVKWDTFLRGPGDSWEQVPWISFEHQLPYSDLEKMFGAELADKIPLSEADKGGKRPVSEDASVRTLLKTGKIQEIWDREKKRVIFLCEQYKDKPLKIESDPLRLSGFFPIPRPIYAIEDSATLVPAPVYEKYKPQAEELNRVTMRINKVVDALKVRGAYASNIAEVAKIIELADSQMLPIENASAVAAIGGLDKAIWIMPIEKLVTVLKELYAARAQILQSIYEITGLSDIMRGASNPHETLGAQQIKSQWGTLRLQNLQREVQRFIRDLLRMKAEVMAEHFSAETLAAISGVQLPSAEEKMAAQMLLHQQQSLSQPQQPGQPPAPQPDPAAMEQAKKVIALPTWDEVMAVLKSDEMRQYSIGIETDSTVEETLTRDAQGLQEAITAITNLFASLAPAIQQGLMSVDVAKSMLLAVARHMRMGQAVEDAIEAIQQPPPAPEPVDNSVEVAQVKAQSDQQIAQMKSQFEAQLEQARLAHEQQLEQIRAAADAQKAQVDGAVKAQQAQLDAAADQRRAAEQEAQAARDHEQKMFEIQTKLDASLAEIASKERTEEIRMRLERETALDRANIERETKLDIADIQANAAVEAAKLKPKPAPASANK